MSIALWRKVRGMTIRIELPPVKLEEVCPGWCWRVMPEDAGRYRPDRPATEMWTCEHELDMD